MSTHYKTDLYTQAQLDALTTKVGDILDLSVPQPDGSFQQTSCKVVNMEINQTAPNPNDPNPGAETFQVLLTLEDQ
jgi:hypothetical protein